MNEYLFITKEIAIPAGTGSGTSRYATDIDTSYDRVIGIAVVEVSNGGNNTYKIGFSDDNTRYVVPAPCNLFRFDKNLKITDRFLPVDIPGKGNKVYTEVVLPISPVSEFRIDVVFWVKRSADKKC